MFHAINAWLARQAQRRRDHRRIRAGELAAATGWRVERVARGVYRSYRDPAFEPCQAALASRTARHAACSRYGPCRFGHPTCIADPFLAAGWRS